MIPSMFFEPIIPWGPSLGLFAEFKHADKIFCFSRVMHSLSKTGKVKLALPPPPTKKNSKNLSCLQLLSDNSLSSVNQKMTCCLAKATSFTEIGNLLLHLELPVILILPFLSPQVINWGCGPKPGHRLFHCTDPHNPERERGGGEGKEPL